MYSVVVSHVLVRRPFPDSMIPRDYWSSVDKDLSKCELSNELLKGWFMKYFCWQACVPVENVCVYASESDKCSSMTIIFNHSQYILCSMVDIDHLLSISGLASSVGCVQNINVNSTLASKLTNTDCLLDEFLAVYNYLNDLTRKDNLCLYPVYVKLTNNEVRYERLL